MRINLIKNNNINPKNHYTKQNCSTTPRLKSHSPKDVISFGAEGFYDRVRAKKRKYGLWADFKWWDHGEADAKEEVEKEMKKEISSWDSWVAGKQVKLDGLKTILSNLVNAHYETIKIKQAEISALERTKENHKKTIANQTQTISTQTDHINETNLANQRLKKLLEEQKILIAENEAQNEKLLKESKERNSQNAAKLQADLQEQADAMDKMHELEMEGLAKKINESARTANPIKKMINIPKPEGFARVAGYKEQKDMLIDLCGRPIVLEKLNKPTVVPNGILLFGPKDCGKSTFVKAFAGQFDCNLIKIPNSLNPRDNIKNLRGAAALAKERFEKDGKRTILWVDKFEEFAPKGSRITGALKGFMDSVSKDYHCTVFATTTSPENIDDILLRDGRFYKGCIPPADKVNTVAILKHYAADFTDKSVDYDKLAEHITQRQSDGAFSNTQIKAVMQTLNQETLMQNVKELGSDIGKEALDLFKKQVEHVKHL